MVENNFKSYSYINGNNILITEKTIEKNNQTWENSNIYGLDLIQKFSEYIQDDFTILDIGAQSGCFCLSAKFYPKTKWYAFEPDPLNFSLLVDNLKLNSIDNVEVYNQALSSKMDNDVLNICANHRGLNTLGKNLRRFSDWESLKHIVNVNTIDNLFSSTKIDLIKIDTEGSEYDIIKGGIETIKKYKPKILLEYDDNNLQQCGRNIEILNELIQEINYEIVWDYCNGDVFIQSCDN